MIEAQGISSIQNTSTKEKRAPCGALFMKPIKDQFVPGATMMYDEIESVAPVVWL